MYGTDLTTPATLELFNNPSIPIKLYSASLVAVRGAPRDNFFRCCWQFTEMGERKNCFCDGVRTDFRQPDCKAVR